MTFARSRDVRWLHLKLNDLVKAVMNTKCLRFAGVVNVNMECGDEIVGIFKNKQLFDA